MREKKLGGCGIYRMFIALLLASLDETSRGPIFAGYMNKSIFFFGRAACRILVSRIFPELIN